MKKKNYLYFYSHIGGIVGASSMEEAIEKIKCKFEITTNKFEVVENLDFNINFTECGPHLYKFDNVSEFKLHRYEAEFIWAKNIEKAKIWLNENINCWDNLLLITSCYEEIDPVF